MVSGEIHCPIRSLRGFRGGLVSYRQATSVRIFITGPFGKSRFAYPGFTYREIDKIQKGGNAIFWKEFVVSLFIADSPFSEFLYVFDP